MKYVFGMATIPSRKKTLQKVLDTIIDHVDFGYLTLNNYDSVPKFLSESRYKKIHILRSQDISDFKDGAKLYPMILLKEDVYYFCCDDDILYPKTYFKYMAKRSDEKKSIISQYGYRLKEKKPLSVGFKESITDKGTWYLGKRKQDVRVHFGGTGVMCINTKHYKIRDLKHFLNLYISDVGADIWLATSCYRIGVPIICVKTSPDRAMLNKIPYNETIHNYLFKTQGDSKVDRINKKIITLINNVFFKGMIDV